MGGWSIKHIWEHWNWWRLLLCRKKVIRFRTKLWWNLFVKSLSYSKINAFREPAAKSSNSQPFRVSIILLQERKPENCKSKRNIKGDFSDGGKKKKRQRRKRNSRVARMIHRIKRERERRKDGMRDRSSSRGWQRRSKKYNKQRARKRQNKSRIRRSERSLVSRNELKLNDILNKIRSRRAERKREQRERRQGLSEAGSEAHYCTGTLLNEKWVITAANCFDVSPFLFKYLF